MLTAVFSFGLLDFLGVFHCLHQGWILGMAVLDHLNFIFGQFDLVLLHRDHLTS